MKTPPTVKSAVFRAGARRAANPFRKRSRVHADRKKAAQRSACRKYRLAEV